VRNRGAAPAAASNIVFYLATQKTYDPVDAVLLGSRPVPSLAAGVINSGSIAVTLPSVAPGRTYYILAIADGQGAIVETSEDNNQTYWPVSIP
jgi:subtilase family serine protease